MLYVFFPLALLAGIATVYAPWIGFLALIVVNPLDYAMEAGVTIYTNELLLLAVLAGFAVRVLRERLSWKEHAAILLWAVPLLIAVGMSAINAQQIGSVAKQALRWLELITTVWFGARALRNEKQVHYSLTTLLIVGTMVAIFGIIQTLAGPESAINAQRTFVGMQLSDVVRAYSTFGHPNQFAGYIILLIPLAVAKFLEADNILSRWLACAAAIILITALIFTYSRGGWIAAFLSSLFLIYVNVPKKIILLGMLAAAIGLTIVGLNLGVLEKAKASVVQRAVSLGYEKEDSVNFRRVCLATAGKMFREHPWVGFGAGEYSRNIRRYFDESYYAWQAINKHLHNLYVQIAAETGVAGLLGFLLWIGWLLWAALKGFRFLPPGYSRQVLAACMAAAAAFLIHNLFDMVTIFCRGMHFAIILGIGLALTRLAKETPGDAPRSAKS